MKQETLKIGTRDGGNVSVQINVAETIEDITSLSRGSLEVALACFNRGWRILNQDQSGARDKYDELKKGGATDEQLVAELTTLISEFDPTVKAPRGGPRVRNVTVKAPKAGEAFDMDAFRAALQAQGVKLTFDNTSDDESGEDESGNGE